MRVVVVGGPHDGAKDDVPDDLIDGMMHIIDKSKYFVHTPKDPKKTRQLIYYRVSKDF